MNKIVVNLSGTKASSYPIFIGPGLLTKVKLWLTKNPEIENIVIITDEIVKNLYGKVLVKALKQNTIKVLVIAFPAGERAKNYRVKKYLEDKMFSYKLERNTLIIALGGGVVGDLAGFTAATYMRGIPYIQIPTTLLAMVDSSLGGKTGINNTYGKNMLGAIWQPKAVIADVNCLKTLTRKQLINGLVEAIKMFLTNDPASFKFALKNLEKILSADEKIVQSLIQRAIKIKAKIVSQDEKEKTGQRMILNFGHTIGHALEVASKYKIMHGFAVGFGILIEAKMAELLGLIDRKAYSDIEGIFFRLGINGKYLKKFSIAEIIQLTKSDKKVKNGKTNYILLKDLGEVYIKNKSYAHPVADLIIKKAFSKVIGV